MSLQLYPNARTDTYTPEHTHAHTQTDACIQHTHARRSSHTITYYKKKSKISFNISPQFTDMVSSYGPVVHVLDPRRGHTTIIYFLWPIYPTLSSQSVHSSRSACQLSPNVYISTMSTYYKVDCQL